MLDLSCGVHIREATLESPARERVVFFYLTTDASRGNALVYHQVEILPGVHTQTSPVIVLCLSKIRDRSCVIIF